MTHTIARLPVSNEAYDEIRGLLENAGYRDYLTEGRVVLDMIGIGLERKEPLPRVDPFADQQPAPEWLAEWAEGGTLGRLERAKAHVESLADVAGQIGSEAGRLRDIVLLTIDDAIAQVKQDDRFCEDLAKGLSAR